MCGLSCKVKLVGEFLINLWIWDIAACGDVEIMQIEGDAVIEVKSNAEMSAIIDTTEDFGGDVVELEGDAGEDGDAMISLKAFDGDIGT